MSGGNPLGYCGPATVRQMAGHFPIADHGIHTLGEKSKATEAPFRLPHHLHTFDLRDVAKPERFQRGES